MAASGQGVLPPPLGHLSPPGVVEHTTDQGQEQAPPPPQTFLTVDNAPEMPLPVSIETHSMSLQWSPVSVTVQSNEVRVVEYLLSYELIMQQLDGNSSSTAPPRVDEDRWSIQYLGPATYVQVRGLRPGRRYAVRVSCRPVVSDDSVVVQLAPPSEVLVVDTPATPPDAPPAPVLATRLKNTLKFKFVEPEETGGRPILQYALEMAPPPLGWEGPPNPEGWFPVYAGPDRSHVVKRLQPGVRYAARVKCSTVMGESPYSLPLSVVTQAAVPSQPAAPLVASATETSVTLCWEPPADNGGAISGYQLEMDDGRGDSFMSIHHGPETSYSLGGLRSGVIYKFRVHAENEAGRSQWSPVCEAVTAATVPSPPPPPTMLGHSQATISITWKAAEFDGGSPVVGYEVEMQPKCKASKRGMLDDWLLVYQGPSKACTLAGLRAGCTYRVRVRAFNARGPGFHSMPADVTTSPDVPEAPASLAPTTRHQTAIALAWAKPEHDGGSAVTAYRLEMSCTGKLEQDPGGRDKGIAGGTEFDAVYAGPDTSAEVADLEPGCRYQFQVLAINKLGASPWSQPVTVDTRPGLPLPPLPPESTATTASSLQLAWAQPYSQGSPVTSYVLQLCQLQSLQQAQQAAARAVHAAAMAAAAAAQGAEEASAGAAANSHEQQQHSAAGVEGLPPGLHMPGSPRAAVTVAEPMAAAAQPASVHGQAPLSNSHGGDELAAASSLQQPGPELGSEELSVQSSMALEQSIDALFETVYHGGELGCTVRGLEPDTEYAYRLKACNSVGSSAWSPIVAARTSPAAPTAPADLAVSEISCTAAAVAWQYPLRDYGSPVLGYQLELAPVQRASRAQPHWRTAYSGAHLHCEVARLAPGREYQLRVRAGNAIGWGQWAEPTSFTTEPDVPDAPEAPSFANRMGSSVRVKWQPPAEDNGSAVAEYFLEMAAGPAAAAAAADEGGSGSGGGFQAVYAGEATSYRMQGLAPGTEYRFRVAAANAVGRGAFSTVGAVATTRAPPAPPTAVQAALAPAAESSAPATVLVSWQPAAQGELEAACISYEVEATAAVAAAASPASSAASQRGPAAGSASLKTTCSARMTQLSLQGLAAGGTYAVRVRGIGADGAGHGEWSEPATVMLPAVEKPQPSPSSARSDEESEGGRARRRKQKGGSGGGAGSEAGGGKAHRAHSLGTKTVTAKVPKKVTWGTVGVRTVAGWFGVKGSTIWRTLWALLAIAIGALVIATALALFFM